MAAASAWCPTWWRTWMSGLGPQGRTVTAELVMPKPTRDGLPCC